MTDQDLQTIHEATLRILRETGVRVEHDEIVGLLLKAGARAGPAPLQILFPPEMVGEYLAMAPAEVSLASRNGATTVLKPGGPSAFWTNPGLYIWTGAQLRTAASADLAAVARLCDHLNNVQGVLGMAIADVPPPWRDFTGLRVIAENCRKHIRVLSFTPEGAEAVAEMKAVFPGAWFSMGFTAHGPLRWTNLALDIFKRTAGHGIPLTINGEPMAGVSGPVSLAGSIAVGNAEILAGVVINQLLEPGRPVVYNLGLAHAFDMRHATAITGGPENALFARASAELGRFYGMPSASWVSTDSVYEDEQAALEKMFGFHAHIASGVSLVWGMGQLESEKTMSLAQLVIDDEMIEYIRRYERGFAVNAEELQLPMIREVGIAGSYLETEHTLQHFKAQLFEPQILNRKTRDACKEPLAGVARRRAEAILAADNEEKIGAAELAELKRIESFYRAKMS